MRCVCACWRGEGKDGVVSEGREGEGRFCVPGEVLALSAK